LSYLNPYEDFPAENCKIIYLFADVDTLAKRIKGKNDNFPINKLPKVLDLYEKWLLSFSFYDICRIDSGKFTVDESIEILKDLVKKCQ
jgi:deoxyadenosine/deoxycytidine kinase